MLENAVLNNLDDDFFNVHNTMQLLVAASGTQALIADVQMFAGPRNSVYGTFETWPYVRVHDRLSFYAINHLQSPVATATVASASAVPHPTPQQEQQLNATLQTLASEGKGCPLSACGPGLRGHGAVQLWAVTLTEAVPATVSANMIVNVDSISASGAVIRNNIFNSTSCNFGRFKSPDGHIDGNRFIGHTCTNNLEVGWGGSLFLDLLSGE